MVDRRLQSRLRADSLVVRRLLSAENRDAAEAGHELEASLDPGRAGARALRVRVEVLRRHLWLRASRRELVPQTDLEFSATVLVADGGKVDEWPLLISSRYETGGGRE